MYLKNLLFILILLISSCGRGYPPLSEDKLSVLKTPDTSIDLKEVFSEIEWDYLCVTGNYRTARYTIAVTLDIDLQEYNFIGGIYGTDEYEYFVSLVSQKNKSVHSYSVPWSTISRFEGEVCLEYGEAYTRYEKRQSTNVKPAHENYWFSVLILQKSE